MYNYYMFVIHTHSPDMLVYLFILHVLSAITTNSLQGMNMLYHEIIDLLIILFVMEVRESSNCFVFVIRPFYLIVTNFIQG